MQLGKITDTGKTPGKSDVDQFWSGRKWPQYIFNVDDKRVRQGTRIPAVYLSKIDKENDLPAFLMNWYGIRGFEFGNWTTEEDRKNYMMGLAAALYDLQQLLGLERHQVSFGGMLSVTFGSRGVPNASAHFDTLDFTINLSRHSKRAFKKYKNEQARLKVYINAMLSRGLHSFVHEYGHAIDYYAGTYLEKTSTGALSGGSTQSRNKIEVKGPLGELMTTAIDKLLYNADGTSSDYRNRLKQENRHQYLLQRNEVFARAFEKYIAYKLKKRGWFNVYFSKFKFETGKDAYQKNNWYPRDNEIARIEKDLDKLIVELRKKIKVKPARRQACEPDPARLTQGTKQMSAGELIQLPEVAAVNFPIAEIHTDTDRFQNREADYSHESVMRIVENFDPNRMDPVRLWKDPANGKVYMLSGHSRLEAHKLMKKKRIPSIFFDGTEKEAIKYARVFANRDNTPETVLEDIKAYVRMRDEEKADQAQLKRTFRQWQKLDAWSFLNPKGKFLLTLASEARTQFPYLENKAQWTGLLREQLPNLTNLHEDEMFDFLFSEKGLQVKRDDFVNLVQQRVQRLDFNPEEALLLSSEGKTGTSARGDTSEAQDEINRLTLENKKLLEQYRRSKTKEEKAELRRMMTRNEEEMQRLANGIRTALRSQVSLFGNEATITRQKLVRLLGERVARLTLEKLESMIEQLKFYLQAFKTVSPKELKKVDFRDNIPFYKQQVEKKIIEAAIARNARYEKENLVPGQMALFGQAKDGVPQLLAAFLGLDGRTVSKAELGRLVKRFNAHKRKPGIRPLLIQLQDLHDDLQHNEKVPIRITKGRREEIVEELHGLGFLPMIAASIMSTIAAESTKKMMNRKTGVAGADQVEGIFDDATAAIKKGLKKAGEKLAPIAKRVGRSARSLTARGLHKLAEKAKPKDRQESPTAKPAPESVQLQAKDKPPVKGRIAFGRDRKYEVVDHEGAEWREVSHKDFLDLMDKWTVTDDDSTDNKFHVMRFTGRPKKATQFNGVGKAKVKRKAKGLSGPAAAQPAPKVPSLFRPLSQVEKKETFRLQGDLGEFLGDLERIKLGITIDGDKGGGKSPLMYQLADAFAQIGLRPGCWSLEMGSDGATINKYRDMNMSPENFDKVMIAGEAPKGIKTVLEFAELFDVIFIDSWTLLRTPNVEFNSLREKHPDKIWIAVFQLTSGGEPRGGPEAHFDAGINIHVVKEDDTFVNNYAVCSKNRYGPTGVHYNIKSKKIIREPEPVSEEQKKEVAEKVA